MLSSCATAFHDSVLVFTSLCVCFLCSTGPLEASAWIKVGGDPDCVLLYSGLRTVRRRGDLFRGTSICFRGRGACVCCSCVDGTVQWCWIRSPVPCFVQTNEFPTFATALWWSSCIVSGNGYGDHIPQSWPGKVIAALVGLLGVLTVALPSGIIGATFVEIMANSNRDTALSSFFSKGGAQDVAGAPMGFGASSTTLNGIAPKKRRNFGDVSKSQRNSRLRHRQSVSSTLSEVDSYTYLPDAIRSRRGSSISTASLPAHANDPYAQTYRNQRLRGTSNVHRARPRRGSNQSTSAGPVVARRSSGGSTTAESPTSAAAADPAGSNAGNSPSSPQTTEAANAPNPLVAGVFQENQELRDRVAALEKKLADLVLSQRPAPLLPSAAAAATSSHEGSEALRCPVCASMLEVALKSQENPQPSPTR